MNSQFKRLNFTNSKSMLNNRDMTCPSCEATETKRFGKHRNRLQRFQCKACHATFTEDHAPAFRTEDYLKTKRGMMAVKLLVEGCSVDR